MYNYFSLKYLLDWDWFAHTNFLLLKHLFLNRAIWPCQFRRTVFSLESFRAYWLWNWITHCKWECSHIHYSGKIENNRDAFYLNSEFANVFLWLWWSVMLPHGDLLQVLFLIFSNKDRSKVMGRNYLGLYIKQDKTNKTKQNKTK